MCRLNSCNLLVLKGKEQKEGEAVEDESYLARGFTHTRCPLYLWGTWAFLPMCHIVYTSTYRLVQLERVTKNSDLKQTYFHTTHPYIETDGTYEAVPTRWPPAASLAAQSLQKPPCCGRLNIGVMEIACGMWDEGRGTGPSAAVWSSLLARRQRRRLGKRGPEWLEEGGCWLAGGARGLPFKGECDSAMGCGFHPHSNADRDACLWNAALEQAHCAVRNNLYFLTNLARVFLNAPVRLLLCGLLASLDEADGLLRGFKPHEVQQRGRKGTRNPRQHGRNDGRRDHK